MLIVTLRLLLAEAVVVYTAVKSIALLRLLQTRCRELNSLYVSACGSVCVNSQTLWKPATAVCCWHHQCSDWGHW